MPSDFISIYSGIFSVLRLVLVHYLNYCNLINLDQKAEKRNAEKKKKCWSLKT